MLGLKALATIAQLVVRFLIHWVGKVSSVLGFLNLDIEIFHRLCLRK